MFFWYGNHKHPVGEVEISSLNARTVFNARGYPEGTLKTITLQGELLGDTNVDVNASILELEAAYSTQNLITGLYFGEPSSPGVASAHSWSPGATLGGIKVIGLDYGNSPGEFSNHRTFSVTLEALFPDYSVNTMSFEETLRFVGTAGQRRVWRRNLDTRPTRQVVNRNTTMRVTQSGRILGYRTLPRRPGPRWPNDEHEEQRQVGLVSPRELRGTIAKFGITYSYSFEFDRAVASAPLSPLGR